MWFWSHPDKLWVTPFCFRKSLRDYRSIFVLLLLLACIRGLALVARVDPMNIANSYPENWQKDISLPRAEQDTCMYCYIFSSCVQNFAGETCFSRYLTCTYNTSRTPCSLNWVYPIPVHAKNLCSKHTFVAHYTQSIRPNKKFCLEEINCT
jgi:hypothetical protein